MAATTSATITARITESASAALQALAMTTNQTMGAIVRTAIEEYLDRQDPDEVLEKLQKAREEAAAEHNRLDALTREAFRQRLAPSGRGGGD